MPYVAPRIDAGHGASRRLADLPGRTLAISMDVPWQVFRSQQAWTPTHLHLVRDMERTTLEALETALPPCDTIVGIGGGSACDTAKYLAWKRGCPMLLVPAIVSVDAPFTNMVAVREGSVVRYVGDIFPEDIVVDYTLIQAAPKEYNRAGACDIASIHTALYDWKLAHERTGERYDEAIAREAQACLEELDRNAAEVYGVTPKGIDTICQLFAREVEFCARLGNSRPEEGAEHIVAYNLEHLTGRHFLHGDIVGLGIFVISRLQGNAPGAALDLIRRCGLRYTCGDATPAEVRRCLETLKDFKDRTGLFYSVVDTGPITPAFIDETLRDLYA